MARSPQPKHPLYTAADIENAMAWAKEMRIPIHQRAAILGLVAGSQRDLDAQIQALLKVRHKDTASRIGLIMSAKQVAEFVEREDIDRRRIFLRATQRRLNNQAILTVLCDNLERLPLLAGFLLQLVMVQKAPPPE